jgi:hypothetical protein
VVAIAFSTCRPAFDQVETLNQNCRAKGICHESFSSGFALGLTCVAQPFAAAKAQHRTIHHLSQRTLRY